MATRRMRAFKRWMASNGVTYSPAVGLVDSGEEGIWVRALSPLREADVVATIPKEACLTNKTSGACGAIEAAGLAGSLGLAVAVMYERSRGEESPWAGYLQLLPEREEVPIVWSAEEVDELLRGTELHKIVKQDKILIHEDWKENIQPLMTYEDLNIDPNYFGVEHFFAAKSLVSSRSFEVDDYHGYGMVPLADLFNHKTGDEDVHFTTVCSQSEFDDDVSSDSQDVDRPSDDKSSISDPDTNSPGDDPSKLEMIIVQDVEIGAEIFNTYGSVGNAALLHRYGFTEPDNPYDIVNIELHLVLQWSTSLFSSRQFRSRLSLWRNLNYSGCLSQDVEYFEITSDGEPQLELLALLYILLIGEEEYQKLGYATASLKETDDASVLIISTNGYKSHFPNSPKDIQEFFMTEGVCHALVSLADAREQSYGSNSLEADMNRLNSSCCVTEKKLYHSLVLRISERTILRRLKAYASRSCKSNKRKL